MAPVARCSFSLIVLLLVVASPRSFAFNAAGSVRLGLAKLFSSYVPPDGPIPAPTCEKIECPPYELVHEETDFQIRRYRKSVWAETEPINEVSYTKAVYEGFHRLFQYIQGRNDDGAHIPMTAPVLTTIKPSGGPFCASSFVVHFLSPKDYASKPPKPDAALNLRIESVPARCVAVRKFSGFASDFNVAQEAQRLANSLESTKWANVTAVAGEAYSIAEYNSPFELLHRVNEIWVPFRDAKSESDECGPRA